VSGALKGSSPFHGPKAFSLRGNIMKLLLCVVAFVATAIATRAADAADQPKPVACLSFEVVRADLAVCSDSKKPFLMRQFTRVKVGEAVVLVGFR